MKNAIAVLLSVFLWSTAHGQGQVWIVDFAGGGDFVTLDAAIAAAADGDTLVVRPGLYNVWSTIDDRSLNIHGDGALVQVEGTLQIQSLTAGKQVVIRGLIWRWPAQLIVFSSAGVVWVDECQIEADLYGGSGAYGAIHADQSSQVIVNNCFVAGSIQYGYYAAPPTDGLHAVNSTVYAMGTNFWGGAGVDTSYPDLAGADGAYLSAATLFINSSTCHGGAGRNEMGGNGVTGRNAADLHLQGSTLYRGPGTPPGVALDLDAGSTVNDYPGSAYGYRADSPVRYGQTMDLIYRGGAGDLVWLFAGLTPEATWMPALQSTLALELSQAWWTLRGVLPANGFRAESVTVPSFAGMASVSVYTQPMFLASDGQLTLGPASAALLLDPAY